MEESKQFQPEYGKEYEFANNPYFNLSQPGKFIGMDNEKFIGRFCAGNYLDYKFIRPIRRTLEDEIISMSKDAGYTLQFSEALASKIMSIIATHRPEVKRPSDDEIKDFFYKYDDNFLHSLVATVRHFLSLANETNGKK